MENIFDPILDKDEVIVKILKPSKTKMVISSILMTFFSLVFFLFVSIMGIIFPDEGEVINRIYILIPIIIFLVIILVVVLFTLIEYKNTYYACTNKRIIIRTGVFGVDFKSLDMGMIGALDVYVSLLDKILRKNTGTIRFGSTSSPIGAQNGINYAFKHIKEPYNEYKSVKTYIDEYKNSQNKQ